MLWVLGWVYLLTCCCIKPTLFPSRMITISKRKMNRIRYKYKLLWLLLAAVGSLSISACGLFRGGCKCPPVHRHSVSPLPALPLQRLGDRNGADFRRPTFQQYGGTGFHRGSSGQYIVYQ